VDLLQLARKYHDDNGKPGSRFALLWIWSDALFWPLMLGWDNRARTSFTDVLGRVWEFNFVNKDMPGSEWSMQRSVELRFNEFEKQFRSILHVKRDLVLVMGKDEEDLRRSVLAATFAITTRPWRLEVDLSTSFVNVELEFSEGLDNVWLAW
jgi:hypothetical protein